MGYDLPKSRCFEGIMYAIRGYDFPSADLTAVHLAFKKGHGSRLDVFALIQRLVRWSVLLPALYFYLGLKEPLYPGTGRLCEVGLQ